MGGILSNWPRWPWNEILAALSAERVNTMLAPFWDDCLIPPLNMEVSIPALVEAEAQTEELKYGNRVQTDGGHNPSSHSTPVSDNQGGSGDTSGQAPQN